MPSTVRIAPTEPAVPVDEDLPCAVIAEFDQDFDSRPEPPEPAKPEPLDPVLIAADQLTERVLERPGLWAQAIVRGAVVILVSGDFWQQPVLTSWRMKVHHETRKVADERERVMWLSDSQRETRDRRPLSVHAGSTHKSDIAKVDDDVQHALRVGRSVIITCRNPDTEVSSVLRAAADAVVRLPSLSPADLQAVAAAVGSGEAPLVADEVAAAVAPDDLRCAQRPGQSAADYVERVTRLVAVRQPVQARQEARWTLDNLPLPEAVEAWGRQLARDLAAFADGKLAWSEVDRGALLFGRPGTGKTTFATALAATCGVPLIAGGYSIWESGEDGKGRYHELIQRMRQAFRQAKEQAPAILFIDEIDSFIARGDGAHNDSYSVPIMNALLAEMDGINGREGVVVVAATNHPQRIDPALRRAGRLDRMLELELPAPPTVARILAAHLDGVAVGDLLPIASSIGRTSGADCERLARGARRRARSAGRPVTAADVAAEVAEERGQQPPRSPERARRIAYHEAGHTVASLLIAPGAVSEVSIRPGGGHGGVTTWTSESMRDQDSPAEIDLLLRRLLAGRAAEEVVLGEAAAGSGGPVGSDLAMATLLAASAEFAWGLGGRLTWFGDPQPETVASMLMLRPDVSARVEQRLTAALAAVRGMLQAHRAELDALAQALLDRETLTGTEAEAVIAAAATRPTPQPRPRLRPEVLVQADGPTGGAR